MTTNENNKEGFDELVQGIIHDIPSMSEAINFCVRMSKRQPKQVQMNLDIDSANYSRMLNGTANFPPDKIVGLMEFCGNVIPLIWLASKVGFEIKPSKITLERQLEETKQEVETLKKTLATILASIKNGCFSIDQMERSLSDK